MIFSIIFFHFSFLSPVVVAVVAVVVVFLVFLLVLLIIHRFTFLY